MFARSGTPSGAPMQCREPPRCGVSVMMIDIGKWQDMAEMVGWWGLKATDSSRIEQWCASLNRETNAAFPRLRDRQACLLLDGPGAGYSWIGDGLEILLLGRGRWKNVPASRAILPEIAHSFKTDGAAFLKDLRGEFLICVFDVSRSLGLVAIDRVGRFPLAYSIRAGSVVFGTDARQVAGHPLVDADLSHQAVFNYLYAHMVPSPHTIFEGVSKLEPGQYLSLGRGDCSVKRYWQMPYAERKKSGFAPAAEEFRGLLRQGVGRCLESEAIGTFLSGGTDSSTVSGLVSELSGRPAEAYSMGFDAPGFDETEYARLAAKHFGCNLHEYYVRPSDVCGAIPLVAAAYDEPFGNASAVPAYLCAKRAREDGNTVLLAGDGGDEIFGGNARYAKQKVFEAYWALPPLLRNAVIEPVTFGIPVFSRGPFTKIRSYVNQARVPLPDRLESYNFLEREGLDEIFDSEFLYHVKPGQPAEIARRSYAEAPVGQSVNGMMHLDLKQTLADNDLRKVVKTCSLAGVDVRFPLLDDDLLEFAAGLPEQWKVKGLKLRWFFKEALKDYLPEEIIRKTKHGFGLPFGLWMTSDPALRSLAYDSLSQLKQRHIIRGAYLDRLVEQHRSGHASYYGVMIWVLMMLEQWFQSNTVGALRPRKAEPKALIA